MVIVPCYFFLLNVLHVARLSVTIVEHELYRSPVQHEFLLK